MTAGENIFYQQNNDHRRVSLVVLNAHRWGNVRNRADSILEAVQGIEPGSFVFIDCRQDPETNPS